MKRQIFFDGAFTVNYNFRDKSQFNVNLLAVDFGDGDIDVAGKIQGGEIGLFRLDDRQSERRANVIATSPTLEKYEVEWIESPETLSGEQDVFYCNFKCSPKSTKFTSAYTTQVEVKTEDEEGRPVTELKNQEHDYQNGELMGLAFAEQFETILSLNYSSSNWKMDKPTVLYVGCPAGTRDPNSEWYGAEEKYGRFLIHALEQYADDHPESYLRKYRDYAFMNACELLLEDNELSEEEKGKILQAKSLAQAKEKSKQKSARDILYKVGLYHYMRPTELIRGLLENQKSERLGFPGSFFRRLFFRRERELFLQYRLPIDIRVVPGPNAAVAYEMNKRYGHRFDNSKIIILIDLGSSTTDFAYINNGKLVDSLNYSRNLGGGMFEENMLKLIQEKDNPDFMFSTSNEKIRLRFAKEDFYNKGNGAAYVTTLSNGEEYGKLITKSFMEKMVSEIPVIVAGSLAGGFEDLQCDSLKDAYRRVFEEYKKRIERDENSRRMRKPVDGVAGTIDSVNRLFTSNLADTPDMIVVTGGVSKVNWVMDLIEDIFGVKPENSKMPHASVAFGLSFVAETELKKDILIREIMGKIKTVFGDVNGEIFIGLRDRIADTCLDKDYEEVNGTMRDWKNNPEPQSIREWHTAYRNKFCQDTNRAVGEVLDEWWKENGFLSKLDQLLKNKFEEIFEDANGDFDFKISDTNLLKELENVTCIKWYFTNPAHYFHTGFFSWSPKDIDLKRERFEGLNSKEKCYERFKQIENSLKNDLRTDYRRMLEEGYTNQETKKLINGVPTMQYIHDTIYSSLEDEVYRYAEYLTNFFYSK